MEIISPWSHFQSENHTLAKYLFPIVLARHCSFGSFHLPTLQPPMKSFYGWTVALYVKLSTIRDLVKKIHFFETVPLTPETIPLPSKKPRNGKLTQLKSQGCSSLDGLLQENGPFLWQSGTSQPNLNPYSWTNLTNMVWVDQPIGVGLSQGVPNLKNEVGVAQEFMGFWQNFMSNVFKFWLVV